jgi:hypothetical protein
MLLNAAGLPEAQGTPAVVAAYGAVVLALTSSAAVGALLASRRPGHPVGWLLLGVGLSVALSVLVESYAKYGLVARPGSLPGARYLAGAAVLTFTIVWLSCAGFVLLLTPPARCRRPAGAGGPGWPRSRRPWWW